MRKNRRDPTDRQSDAVWANPRNFTRAVRRSVGYRKPVSNAYTDGYRAGAQEVLDRIMQPKEETNANE